MIRLLSFFLLLPFIGKAQNINTISGYIEDTETGERLIGVNVYVPGSNHGTSTNAYGFYSLALPSGEYTVTASFIGYDTDKFSANLSNGSVAHNFLLKPSSAQLDEVEVTATEIPLEQAEMSTISLSIPEIQKMPAFMGEVDIIRAIQLLPGVQSGTEGTTGFYVRGGSPDQNLILLDGVPVYNASHLFGFFSVFNSDAIKNVTLTKGGFPARYGGRLSSVLDINMKEGNMKEFHGAGSIGLISSKLTLEGPIIKDKTSFIISGRRMYYDLLLKPFLPKGLNVGYFFGDVNLKVNHIISPKDRLYLSYYGGKDKYYYHQDRTLGSIDTTIGSIQEYSEQYLQWGNQTGSVRWNHLFNSRLFGNLTASYTRYKFEVGYNYEKNFTQNGMDQTHNEGFNYLSLIEDYGLRYDLDFNLNQNHYLKGGLGYTYHTFRPGAAVITSGYNQDLVDSTLNLSQTIFSNEIFSYLEDDWTLNDRWRANMGLHYSQYFVNGITYKSLQPRISLRYLINDEWAVKGSYSYMNQYIHLLSNTGIGLPVDLWVSSTDKVKPQIAQQIALGSTKHFSNNKLEFTVEAYYKWMDQLITYQQGSSFVSGGDWQNNVEANGKGNAYGAEFLLRKNKGKTTGWIGYTLSWSNRQFENINYGEKYPYRYDRRHDISIVLNHKFNEKIDIGATWVYNTGNSFTAPQSDYYLNGNLMSSYTPIVYTNYTTRNELKMPAYHRLDLSINFHKKKKWGERIWNVSIYNVYSRNNPFYLYVDKVDKSVWQQSLFPIIPSFSYIFKF